MEGWEKMTAENNLVNETDFQILKSLAQEAVAQGNDEKAKQIVALMVEVWPHKVIRYEDDETPDEKVELT